MNRLTTIGFDADDTLWHNERHFRLTQDRFEALLAQYAQANHLHDRLLEAERRNIAHYGYGAKGFTLSMIETAVEVTDGKVPATIIAEILAAGRELMAFPVECLPGVTTILGELSRTYRLVLITKGDLFDQERKLAQSGLGDLFNAVEIVSEKTPSTYRELFQRHGTGPQAAMMVGNSLKSDVVPALEAGAWAVHVPHELTWALEHADEPASHSRYRKAASITDLPVLLSKITRNP
ncbi:MAG: HAD family hydrolase [Rhizobiaceae bacterium]